MSDLYKLLEEGEMKKALELVNEDEFAWEDLMGLLEDSDESIQRSAFEIVSKSGDNPRLLDALPMLISGLDSDEEIICRYAAEALYYLGSDASEATESLSRLLHHDDDEVRRAVARVFSQMGSSALEVKEPLIEALEDSDEVVRGEIALALANLGNEVPEAIPALIALLVDEEEFIHDGKGMEVRIAAQSALGQIGQDAVPGLLEAMRADRPEQRAMAVSTLASIESLPEGAVKDIEEAVQDPDSMVQAAAKKALKQMKVKS
ncbi:MAG: HEAT repeat domain-containing protein [Candidatus Odinarchaeota archaeon]